MMQDQWNAAATAAAAGAALSCASRTTKSAPCSPVKPAAQHRPVEIHVALKIPVGDTPYVKAKRVQLVDKDPDRAIAMFWAAINAGDRVDSALKDMAIVMKQQNRAEEAIEAIKSLRSRCSDQAQESLDNILLDLYKRCGRLDEQIALLKHKLQLIQQGLAFNGRRTKTARSQGRKFQVTLEQEATRLLGNLGWALMQKQSYSEAETAYRKALLIGADNNKMCNLGICLMKQGRVAEAKEILKQVKPAASDGAHGADSHLKAFDRAQEMLRDVETKLKSDQAQARGAFDMFTGPAWQPVQCADARRPPLHAAGAADLYGDENALRAAAPGSTLTVTEMLRDVSGPSKPFQCVNAAAKQSWGFDVLSEPAWQQPVQCVNPRRRPPQHVTDRLYGDENAVKAAALPSNTLNVTAPPFYSWWAVAASHDPLGTLKRTRSGNPAASVLTAVAAPEKKAEERWPELPDEEAFEAAMVAAIVAPAMEERKAREEEEAKMGKRLRIFEDITLQSLNMINY